MAYAICKSCGIAVQWFAGRGRKLKNIPCPKCKGNLKASNLEEFLNTKERMVSSRYL